MIKLSIVGATGYVGLELVRILASHPNVTLQKLVSQTYVGKKFSDIYPSLRGICDIECSELNINELKKSSDFVITALPHNASKAIIPELLELGLKVIDHSAHFRYKNIETFEKTYKTSHGYPDLQANAVYGLPELYRDQIKNASLIADPGCYPTCSVLGLAPAVSEKLIDLSSIIINAVSGVSGAGRKEDLSFSFCELDSNYKAYGVTNHRHTSEIEQELSALANESVNVSFTPHLAPFKRGMLATTHVNLSSFALASEVTTEKIHALYSKYYQNEDFVRILPLGEMPEIKNVVGSNFVDIGIMVDHRVKRLVIVSALDNLIKGSAGQAIQALNIMAGLDESTGLKMPGMQL
ncbi:MAG: N-acetyl-gamma-glutamyl-phosphate reductase [Bacillota bacterium]